jgi:hypothetical protein
LILFLRLIFKLFLIHRLCWLFRLFKIGWSLKNLDELILDRVRELKWLSILLKALTPRFNDLDKLL